MKLIVAGGRDFTDTQRMIQALQELAADSHITNVQRAVLNQRAQELDDYADLVSKLW